MTLAMSDRFRSKKLSPILGPDGLPIHANGNGQRKHAEIAAVPIRRRKPANGEIHATYDLAQTLTDNQKHWAFTDSYDADSANSRVVREILTRRSRYESSNNGIVNGIQRTHATFVIRKGPKLRLLADDEADQQESIDDIEAIKRDWRKWCQAIQFRRKLWCMAHAKFQDGETIGIVEHNPKVKHAVKLDVKLVETEQCQTPMLMAGVKGKIDGIDFDDFGNPERYHILPQHPGASMIWKSFEPIKYDAKYILHWYELERPGQHRGIPILTSTLGLGAVHRRWREATVAGAETIADISLIAQTQGPPDEGPDEFAPFGAVEWQKRMMMMLPMGWNVFQPKGEQPPANYDQFTRAGISELARPVSMPLNLANADSSQSSFASGKLDTIPYYMVVDDVEREDCNDLVLDPLFALWWEEYILVQHAQGEMLDWDADEPPEHTWDWARNPVADMAAEVRTDAERIRTGQAAPSDIAHENGYSFEEMLRRYAKDYGVSVDEVRSILMQSTIAPKSGGTLGGGSEGQPVNEAGAVKPEPNGQDAPNMEQMSMMVAQLAVSIAGMQKAILAIGGTK